jgi:signal transduction histidine kinase
VKEFIDAHGGTIEVQTQQNEGSTFTVRLPLVSKPVSQAQVMLN